jgi:hypothetical protein
VVPPSRRRDPQLAAEDGRHDRRDHASLSLPSPAAARTRLLLEGPIVSTLLRLTPANLVVNVVLIAVTASVDAHFVGQLGIEPLAGLSLVFPF